MNVGNENGTKIKSVLCFAAAGVLFLSAVLGAIFGYAISGSSSYGEPCDGFGRLLAERSPVMSVILPQWAGLVWFWLDCFLAIMAIVAADNLIAAGIRFRNG